MCTGLFEFFCSSFCIDDVLDTDNPSLVEDLTKCGEGKVTPTASPTATHNVTSNLLQVCRNQQCVNANFQVPTCPFGCGMECCGNGVSVDTAIGGVVSMVTQSPPPLCRFVQIKVYVLVLKTFKGLTVVQMVSPCHYIIYKSHINFHLLNHMKVLFIKTPLF